MKIDIVVLLKQVPDTRNVTAELMTAEGLVNRSALPTIVNPHDIEALDNALSLKEQSEEAIVRLLTMGPPSAADVLREGLWRGADSAVLLSDRALGGADTLATSYALAQAIRKMGMPDVICCGQQSLDGDTGHVGPQVAELLGINQVTNVLNVIGWDKDKNAIVVLQERDKRVVQITVQPPVLLAFKGKPRADHTLEIPRLLKYKHAATKEEQRTHSVLTQAQFDARPYLTIEQWNADDIHADASQIGLQGSPTRVMRTEAISFAPKGGETFTDSDADLARLVNEITPFIHS